MIITVLYIIFTIIGIVLFPIFTLGAVLIHYQHPILGAFAIIISVLSEYVNQTEK